MRFTAAYALSATLLGTANGGVAHAGADVARKPIVTVVRHGGLCVTGRECRAVFRVTDRTISGPGMLPRRIKSGERSALLRAIRTLDLASLRAHPFTGTCPTAYDGMESIYRFRGFSQPVASCTYDVRNVSAVRMTERLLTTLKPR